MICFCNFRYIHIHISHDYVAGLGTTSLGETILYIARADDPTLANAYEIPLGQTFDTYVVLGYRYDAVLEKELSKVAEFASKHIDRGVRYEGNHTQGTASKRKDLVGIGESIQRWDYEEDIEG